MPQTSCRIKRAEGFHRIFVGKKADTAGWHRSSCWNKTKTMPGIRLSLLLVALLAFPALSHFAHSEGTVSFYGFEINQPRWRSTKVPKTITLAAGGTATVKDGFFGALGWTLPGLAAEAELPEFVMLQDLNDPATQTFRSPTYSDDLDDPVVTPAPEVDRIPANFKNIAYQYPGQAAEATLLSIPLTGTIPPAFLVGIAFGNLAHPDEDAYSTASFRASINDGPGTKQIPAIGNDGLVDWIFFRVENAVAGDTLHIHGTGGPNGMASIALITFDPVP